MNLTLKRMKPIAWQWTNITATMGCNCSFLQLKHLYANASFFAHKFFLKTHFHQHVRMM